MSALNALHTRNFLVEKNQRNQTIVGHREKPGQWAAQNLDNGAQFEIERLNNMPGDASHWGVTRTGPRGVETYNDFTVTRNGNNQVRLHDLNRSGFQPLEN